MTTLLVSRRGVIFGRAGEQSGSDPQPDPAALLLQQGCTSPSYYLFWGSMEPLRGPTLRKKLLVESEDSVCSEMNGSSCSALVGDGVGLEEL